MYSGLRFDVLRGAALVGILALAVPLQAFAQQGVIRGTVRDADSGDPIFLATVQIVGTAAGFVTDEDGRFTIRAQPGTYTVRASMLGYASAQQRVTLGAGDAITLDFDLSVSALAIDEIIAVGTRTTRTRLESPVAVDVITAAEIALVGELELNQILRTLAPSYNASHQTISDGTDHVNPASLRGLGPDQTLVLINGKRRHHSSLVNVNGTFGRGTVGTDLNAIPAAAIERIEILRDGASAQYGSDAIAGVINIVLKEQYQQVQINGTAGFNPGTAVGGRSADADGEQIKANANFGFRVGQRGFFNVTGSYLSRNRTNRSGIYTGSVFIPQLSTPDSASRIEDGLLPLTDAEKDSISALNVERAAADEANIAASGFTREGFSMKIGQSDATVGALWFNSVFPIAETGELRRLTFFGLVPDLPPEEHKVSNGNELHRFSGPGARSGVEAPPGNW